MTYQTEVSNLISPFISVYKALNAEWDNYFQIGLGDYLQSQTEKYYFTNTFLHRSEKVKFNDIYYPIKASYKSRPTEFNDTRSLFNKYKNITIIGSAGSGKTTLLKHIFLNTITTRSFIPILVELRNLNEYDGDFEKLITEKVFNSRVKANDITFKRTLKSGKFLFLLDGYDEIFSTKKQEINRQIELFVDSYSNNKFLITTRPGSGIEGFPRFYDFHVNSLEDEDVEGFISKIVEEGERKERIVKIIKDPKNNSYLEYLRNPLLLSMFILAFESHPEIPQRKSAFYRNVFDTLYSRHDGITKNSFPREKLTKLQRDDFEYLLAIFSYLTLIEGQYAFTLEYLTDILAKVKKTTNYDFNIEALIYDLQTSISILILDGFEYYFPHRSMQEYFTALFISKLPTNRRSKAYNNLSKTLQESSTDYSFNFWSLCFELDETIFISNFLIPQLKRIHSRLEHKKGRALLDEYFKISNPILLRFEMDANDDSEIHIYRHASFENSILDFCDVSDYADVWHFPKLSGCREKLKGIFEKEIETKKPNSDMILVSQNENVITLLIEHGLPNVIEDLRNKVKEKVLQWEESIKHKNNNIDELLNI